MLIWKRLIPSKVRAILALGTVTALVAVAALKPIPSVWGQDKEATRKVEKQVEGKSEKRAQEPVPVKEAEPKQAGRNQKTEKEPVKREGREGNAPVKEEGDVPRNVKGKVPEGRPVPRQGDPEISRDPIPGRVRPIPGREMKELGEGNRPDRKAPKEGPLPFNGGISFDAKNSSTCGKGQICFNYALPTKKTSTGTMTGTLVITLNIYQNGTQLVFTPPTLMQSGVLEDGNHYCFDVDPTTFPGIDLGAGYFDFVASAKFSLAGADTTILVGSVPQGVVPNENNDYRIVCAPGGGTGVTPGRIIHDARTSTNCGKGQICFNLTLPTMKDAKGNVIATATGVIHLTLYQNGQPILSLPASPVLNDKTGTRYCFPIDPENIKHLNCDLGGFDFVATANFTFSSGTAPDTSATAGTSPTGIIPEVNNDYLCECQEDPGTTPQRVGCCLGKETVVYTEDFQHPQEIASEYERLHSLEEHLIPGTFVVTDVKGIEYACRNWRLPAACLKTHDFSGNVLLINGLTSQKPPAPATAVVWSHDIVLPESSDVKEAEYRVCFHYLPLPQCCFDIPARPHLALKGVDGPLTVNSDSDSETGCGRLSVATFHAVPGSTIKLEILLDGNGMGDGNDLLIDNISVTRIVAVPATVMYFALVDGLVTGGVYDATATASGFLTHGPYSWDWVLTDDADTTLSMGTPNTTTYTFTGLSPGNKYWVKLLVWSDCNSLTGRKRPSGDFPTVTKKAVEPDVVPHPERVKHTQQSPSAKLRSE